MEYNLGLRKGDPNSEVTVRRGSTVFVGVYLGDIERTMIADKKKTGKSNMLFYMKFHRKGNVQNFDLTKFH